MINTETVILALVGLTVLVALGVWWMMRRRRSGMLRARYGDEYDRTVQAAGGRSAAEANLAAREKRMADLSVRSLTPEERDRFSGEWHEVKALFVDSPVEAALHADRTLTSMLETRGFPMADFDRRYEDLTVHHAETARHYRTGHEIVMRPRGEATTEELRRAMKHFGTLFDEMIAETGVNMPLPPVMPQGMQAPGAVRTD